jgi:DNA replication and repair protein RecF
VGKTNLLESVYFSSLFKSFRDDTEFIFLKDETRLELQMNIEKDNNLRTLEVFLEKRDKIYANFKIDGVKTKKQSAQGFVSVVVFDPSDVDMFSKSPDVRRKYLNMVLCQKSPGYLDDLSEYKKSLFQKTRLLQDMKASGGIGNDTLEAWNLQLADLGARILVERKKFINYLNGRIADIYTSISGFHRPVEVWYKGVEGEDLEQLKQNLLQKIADYRNKEISAGSCLVGPHRDDFFLKSEGLFLPPFSSRGELRSQVLALKILELEFLSQGEDRPILLLDDVLSELDDTRKNYLLKYLGRGFQTFITTTQILDIPAQHISLSPAEELERV